MNIELILLIISLLIISLLFNGLLLYLLFLEYKANNVAQFYYVEMSDFHIRSTKENNIDLYETLKDEGIFSDIKEAKKCFSKQLEWQKRNWEKELSIHVEKMAKHGIDLDVNHLWQLPLSKWW
tara:strand:+ start:63 stop:431 length:369 start_codon:yes stop_codon:yes gene_type:complete